MVNELDLLTSGQIAAELGVSIHAVRELFRDGKLHGRKVANTWTTTRRALNQWLESGTGSATATESATGFVLETPRYGQH
jgi:hypothetical protein